MNILLKSTLLIFIWLASQLPATSLASQKDQNNPTPKDVEVWEQECSKNNLGSCARLAEHKESTRQVAGLGQLWQKLCESGEGGSCMKLGGSLQDAGKPQQSIKWYRIACNLPHHDGAACFSIAEIATQQGSVKNAAHWHERGCQRGYMPSCKHLGKKETPK